MLLPPLTAHAGGSQTSSGRRVHILREEKPMACATAQQSHGSGWVSVSTAASCHVEASLLLSAFLSWDLLPSILQTFHLNDAAPLPSSDPHLTLITSPVPLVFSHLPLFLGESYREKIWKMGAAFLHGPTSHVWEKGNSPRTSGSFSRPTLCNNDSLSPR